MSARDLRGMGINSPVALHFDRAFDRLFNHDAPARDELQGSLAPSEREAASELEQGPSDRELEQATAEILLGERLCPDEYLCCYSAESGGPPTGETENAYLALRMTVAHAMVMPTHANLEAIGSAALTCARLAMRERAADHIAMGRD